MTPDVRIRFERISVSSAGQRFVLFFLHANQGRTAVTLALKWDVIAVCAVFVFVGAVLLGAF